MKSTYIAICAAASEAVSRGDKGSLDRLEEALERMGG